MSTYPLKRNLLASAFVIVTIYSLALAAQMTQLLLLIPPFGASSVLIFAFPESPYAKMRSLVAGHLIASAIGITLKFLFPDSILAMAVAVGLSLFIMLITKTFHPAAGADPVLIYAINAGADFLIAPMLVGTLFLALMNGIYRKLIDRL